MSEALTDSPTHRLHILQLSMPQFKEDLEKIRVRRASIVEKAAKAKSNSKIAREATVNKQLQRFFKKLEKDIAALDRDMTAIEDNMNKARALILELSDGEVLLPKTEINSNGS
jgi:septal ring factor EnvC (AmiA/AmiB activator)